MKLAIVFCAVLGLSLGAVLPKGDQRPAVFSHETRNLNDLLNELLSMIPMDKIVEILVQHLESDPEVQEAAAYLKSDDFKKMVTTVEGMGEFKDFLDYLHDSGIDSYHIVNVVNDLLGLPHINPVVSDRKYHHANPRSIMSMIMEMLAVIPIDEIKAFYHDKVENDPDFQALLARLRSPEFKKIVDAVKAMPQYTDLLNRLKEHGIPVDEIVKAIDDFFGWGRMVGFRSTRNLHDLLDELLSMIPMDKIVDILVQHLENDPEVQEAAAYLKSDDFKKMVSAVESMPEFKDFIKYLHDSGLDSYKFINIIDDVLGLPHINPVVSDRKYHHANPRSIMSMIMEMLAVIPIDEIKAFYHDKVENDPDFQALLARLRSPEFKKIVDAVKAMPQYTDLINRLKEHGIPVDEIVKTIDDFFGWGRMVGFRSTRNLNDLLNELLSMIPMDKIVEILVQHLESDPEVQEAAAYLKSDDFKKMVTTVESMPEFMDFIKYLYDSGIDSYHIVNVVNDLLGLPHINPVVSDRKYHHANPRSIMSMIMEMLAVIPIDEIKAFYHDKVENDPDFQALLARLRSPEFKKIVDAVKAMPQYTDLLNRLKEHGIPVDEIVKAIDDFFGWGRMIGFRSTRNLNDLLNELLSMIPMDKIVEILVQHLESDPEVQEAAAYLKSDDFKKMVTTVENMPEFMDFIKYLYDSGIDSYHIVNVVNDLLGLPHINPVVSDRKYHHANPRSIMSMIMEMLAVIPIDEIKAFYHDKVENDPDFQALLARLRSPEFKKIVDAVKAMPQYTDLLNRLKEHGIPVDEIVKTIDDFFGWGRMVGFRSTRNLNDLLNELLSMIPMDKIVEILVQHLESDPEVQEAAAYLKSDDFKKMVTTVESMPEFMDFIKYLYDSGIDSYHIVNVVNDLLGLPHINPVVSDRKYHHANPRSIMSMIMEMLAVIPIDEIKAFYHDKVENDPDFQALLARLRSPEFKKIVDAVKAMPQYTDLLNRLKEHGIPVDEIVKAIDDFFGWGRMIGFRSTRNLNDLLNELLSMIPMDKIVEILVQHLESDPEVQEAAAYLKSDDFKKMVTTVENMPEFMDFIKYLYDSGIDSYHIVNVVNDLLGLPHINPVVSDRKYHHANPRSIMSMIMEMLAVIPIDEIKAFYHDKVENDPDFQALLARLRSPEFKKIVDAVKAMPQYTDLLNRLKEHGIPVDEIVKAIDDFFGWGRMIGFRSTRNLNDLLNELLSMIPMDKIVEILVQHLESDPEVQEAAAYLKSDDFKKMVTTVENMPEFMDFIKYLYDSGIDSYHIVNVVNDLLGLPHINPVVSDRKYHRANPRSIMSMIMEMLAVIPIDEIKAFYHDKVENDPDFQALLARLRSPEFKKIVDAVKAMPQYTDLLNRLKEHGIPVDEIVKAIDDFFGWGRKIRRYGY
ncbi:uncharacterized protein LOC124169130 isoform X3 [Ischnura elegans]|uniref:uncharacterized protein LOC124169130 isoform X3 n=1 Tax=Ischnura elegans TaxID=197161 RepID=UPI001ED88986|nr:uncharacterized protein LOC124169130 isoform X3 [Ischnura elegans]